MSIFIPAEPQPLDTREVQAGKPLMSGHETGVSRETSALWYRTSPTHRHWFWKDPENAPFVTFTSSDLESPFSMVASGTDPEAQFPWYMHPNAVRITADAYIVGPADVPLEVRLETAQMGDAMTEVQGHYSSAQDKAKALGIPGGLWGEKSEDLGYSVMRRVKLNVIPTPPSSRRFALQVGALWAAAWPSNVTGGDETTTTMYLYALVAHDVLESPV